MSVTAERMVEMQEQLAKGNLVGEEAEVAQKALDEATAAKAVEDAEKKAEEDKLTREKMTDDEKAAADKKAEEEKAVADEKAAEALKVKEEAEAKEAYDKLSGEEKEAHEKKVAEEAEAAEQAERDKRNKGIKIPKFRLDAATARARKAEAERDDLVQKLADAEKAKPDEDKLTDAQKHEVALAAIDTKLAEAMKEGDATEASKLMAESRTMEREFQSTNNDVKLQEANTQTTAQLNESQLVNSILDQLEEQYPMFNENSDQFNAEANADVLKIQRGLMATGETASGALVEAVNMVLPKYGVVSEEDDNTSEKDAEAAKKIADKAAKDKADQVKKNLDAASKTAPDMDNAGDDSDAAGAQSDLPNAADLTDAEYDALPAATLKRMRGDDF